MKDLTPETQARHELAVIDFLFAVGQAKIKQIVQSTDLDENAVRWALQRQEGISVTKVKHGTWACLTEGGDQEIREIKPTKAQQKDMAFLDWVSSQGIEHAGVFLTRKLRYYLKDCRFDEVEIGQIVCFGKDKRFLRVGKIDVSHGRIRFWSDHGKTPALAGEPDQIISIRVVPDPKLYL